MWLMRHVLNKSKELLGVTLCIQKNIKINIPVMAVCPWDHIEGTETSMEGI